MMDEALDFIVRQLNEFLLLKTGSPDIVILRRLATISGEYNPGGKVVCQLINVEEERVGKAQMPISRPVGNSFKVLNPELRLNLSVMFSATSDDDDNDSNNNYLDSIRLLSYVVHFFQYKHLFNKENSPSMPASLGSLILELYPVSLENQNYLWASLGVKYRPSVVYKIRLLTVLEDDFNSLAGTINSLDVNLNTL